MYNILLLPVISGIIAQFIKLFTGPKGQKINYKRIMAYSGMPSGHSAIVISLASIIGLEEGIGSSACAISFILAVIVIRDALGIRQYLGQHGKILNILVKDLKDDKVLDENYPHLIEHLGHTPAQVVVGGIIGFLISLAGYWIVR